MTPKISIIVPIYQVESYLAKCIDSILNQTYKDFEVILIDDGSTDKSGIICDNYAKNNSKISVYHISNSGVSNARLYGIKKASGDYISFVDADDFISPNAIGDLYEWCNAYNLDIVIGAFNIFNDQHTRYISINNEIIDQEEYIKRLLQQKTDTGPCGKLYRRQLFESTSFFPIIKGEDYLMNLELATKINKVGYRNVLVYNYFQRQNSVIHQHKTNLLYEKEFNSIAKNILLKNNIYRKYSREFLTFSINQLYTLYIYNCDFNINDEWINCIKYDSQKYKLSLKEKVTIRGLNIKNIRKIIYFVRKLFYKYIYYIV